jgi:hypothetical protein
MIIGLTPLVFFHTAISLAGIVSGLVVLAGMLAARQRDGWTLVFLVTTVATSATGFVLPFFQLLPSHIIGIVSLVVLAVVLVARYARHLAGPWRWIYAGGAVLALYLNVFVLVVQLFRRVPALSNLAPTQSEPPFQVVQLIVLLLFIWLGIRAVKRFRPA